MLRRILTIVIVSLGLSGGPLAAQGVDLEGFFKLVATGDVMEAERALEQNSALATARDRFGFSAVHVLDYNGFSEKLTLLKRFGANVNARNDEGIALLHIIIDPEFIPAAVAAGGDINLRDFQGRTPVMVRLLEPDAIDFIPAYLTAGADLNARDKSGKSVLEYAEAHRDPELTLLLVQAGAVR